MAHPAHDDSSSLADLLRSHHFADASPPPPFWTAHSARASLIERAHHSPALQLALLALSMSSVYYVVSSLSHCFPAWFSRRSDKAGLFSKRLTRPSRGPPSRRSASQRALGESSGDEDGCRGVCGLLSSQSKPGSGGFPALSLKKMSAAAQARCGVGGRHHAIAMGSSGLVDSDDDSPSVVSMPGRLGVDRTVDEESEPAGAARLYVQLPTGEFLEGDALNKTGEWVTAHELARRARASALRTITETGLLRARTKADGEAYANRLVVSIFSVDNAAVPMSEWRGFAARRVGSIKVEQADEVGEGQRVLDDERNRALLHTIDRG